MTVPRIFCTRNKEVSYSFPGHVMYMEKRLIKWRKFN